jgi:GNAT superfamily N-acetyltransferase
MTSDTKSILTLPEEGLFPLKRGKLATLVTYLSLDPVAKPVDPIKANRLTFERVKADQQERYLEIFRRIGQPWLWFSRLLMAPDKLRIILDDPGTLAFVVCHQGQDIGLCEVDARNESEAELAYLGLIPEACGHGWGRVMMDHAISLVMERGITRMIVHTCQLDDPRALGFYRSCGFNPYQLALEVMDDPRAIGLYPPDSAPQIPFLND